MEVITMSACALRTAKKVQKMNSHYLCVLICVRVCVCSCVVEGGKSSPSKNNDTFHSLIDRNRSVLGLLHKTPVVVCLWAIISVCWWLSKCCCVQASPRTSGSAQYDFFWMQARICFSVINGDGWVTLACRQKSGETARRELRGHHYLYLSNQLNYLYPYLYSE